MSEKRMGDLAMVDNFIRNRPTAVNEKDLLSSWESLRLQVLEHDALNARVKDLERQLQLAHNLAPKEKDALKRLMGGLWS